MLKIELDNISIWVLLVWLYYPLPSGASVGVFGWEEVNFGEPRIGPLNYIDVPLLSFSFLTLGS